VRKLNGALVALPGNRYRRVAVKPIINLEEIPGKVVGHRHAPTDGLAGGTAQRIGDARAWKRALRTLPIPKGVYRFRTHEEADEWLWQMVTRPRR
jgi:hypothetical protein